MTISSETLEQRVRRTEAAHLAARKAGGVVPHEIAHASAMARLELHRQTVGPELFDRQQAWGTAQILDRASRLVAQHGEVGHNRERMLVVSHEQFAEIKATGTTTSPAVATVPPQFEG